MADRAPNGWCRWAGLRSRRWRHTRTVSVTFAPNEGPPRKTTTSSNTVDARVVTADADRMDEFRCLVDLAVKTATTPWKPPDRTADHPERGIEDVTEPRTGRGEGYVFVRDGE